MEIIAHMRIVRRQVSVLVDGQKRGVIWYQSKPEASSTNRHVFYHSYMNFMLPLVQIIISQSSTRSILSSARVIWLLLFDCPLNYDLQMDILDQKDKRSFDPLCPAGSIQFPARSRHAKVGLRYTLIRSIGAMPQQ